jgi:peptidoglycan-associated lipoprotein
LACAAAVALGLTGCTTKPKTTPEPAAASREVTESTQIVPGSVRDFQANVGDRVRFAYNRSDLDSVAQETLRRQAAWLAKYPSVSLLIEGHCDERGTREYNIALGARRAQAARDYLFSAGVAGARLETLSYGKERPECAESNEACWAQNRRALSAIKNGSQS